MARQPKFTLTFAPEAVDHLDAIDRKHHRHLERSIDEQLTFTPERVSRNRNPLEEPAPWGATWELRCGPQNQFRVFYEVDPSEQTVLVLRIGVKERDRLFFGGEEFKT
jgi:mRNA-degrading endonuclease RelE of RelBE toxin-antitoxin system